MQELYKQELYEAFGVEFNQLFCINNVPVKRYADYLRQRNELESYMQVSLACTSVGPMNAGGNMI